MVELLPASVSCLTLGCRRLAGMKGVDWIAGCILVWRQFGTKFGHSLPPRINKRIIKIPRGFTNFGCIPSEEESSNRKP